MSHSPKSGKTGMDFTGRRTHRMIALFGSPLWDLEDTEVPLFLGPPPHAITCASPKWIFSEEVTECPPTPGRGLFPESPSRTPLITKKEGGENGSTPTIRAFSHRAITRDYQSKDDDRSPRPDSDLSPYTSSGWTFLADDYSSEVTECPPTPGHDLFPESPSRTPHWGQTRTNTSPITKKEDGEQNRGCSPLVFSYYATTNRQSKGGVCPLTPGSDLFAESLSREQVRTFTRDPLSPLPKNEGPEWIGESFPTPVFKYSPRVVNIDNSLLGSDCPPTPGTRVYPEIPCKTEDSTPNQNSPLCLTKTENEKTTDQVGERFLSVFPIYSARTVPTEHSLEKVESPHMPHHDLFPESQSTTQICLPPRTSSQILTNLANEEALERERSPKPGSIFSPCPDIRQKSMESAYCPPTHQRDPYQNTPNTTEIRSHACNSSSPLTNSENEESTHRIEERSLSPDPTFYPSAVNTNYLLDEVDFPPTPGRYLFEESPFRTQLWSRYRNSAPSLSNTENEESSGLVEHRSPSPVPSFSPSVTNTDYPSEEEDCSHSSGHDNVSGSSSRAQDWSPLRHSSPPLTNKENEEAAEWIGHGFRTPVYTFSHRMGTMDFPADRPTTPGRNLYPKRPCSAQVWPPTRNSSSLNNTENKEATVQVRKHSPSHVRTCSPSADSTDYPFKVEGFSPTPRRDIFPGSPLRGPGWSPTHNSSPSVTDSENECGTDWIGEHSTTPTLTFSPNSFTVDYLSEEANFPPTPRCNLLTQSPLKDLVWSPNQNSSRSVTNSEDENSTDYIGEYSMTPSLAFSPNSSIVNSLSEETDFPFTPGRNLFTESPCRTQICSATESSPSLSNTEDEAPERRGESCPSPVPTFTSSPSTMEIRDCPLTPGRDLFSDSPDLVAHAVHFTVRYQHGR